MWAGLLLGALGALLVFLSAVAPAGAHAEVVGVDPPPGAPAPRAPDRIRLRLSEPVERGVLILQVFGPDGSRVDGREARLTDDGQTLETGLRDAGSGRYRVVWRVLSTDGHVTRGGAAIDVGGAPGGGTPGAGDADAFEGAPGPSPFWGAASRWLTYVGAFAVVGGLAAGPLTVRPALRLAGSAAPALDAAVARRRLRWALWGTVALLLLTLASLVNQAAEVTGLPWADAVLDGVAVRLAGQTRYGLLWAARAGLLLALLAVLLVTLRLAGTRGATRRRGRLARLGEWIGFEVGVLFLLALAAGGHAGAGTTVSPLAVGMDWLHLLAGALWIGGLLQLGLVLGPALAPSLSEGGDGLRERVLGAAGRRFAWVAAPSVAVLAATGLYAGRRYLPEWDSLAATAYGAALTTKLLLAVPLLALGGVAFWRLRRRPLEAGPGRAPSRGVGTLGGLVRAEALLGVLVLAAAGVLTGLPPATSAPGAGRPFAATRWAGDVRLRFTVVPNTAGVTNRLTVTLDDRQGRPVAAERVKVTLRQLDGEAVIEETAAGPLRTGHLPVSALLNAAGPWRAEVSLGTPAGMSEAPVAFDFRVGQAAGTGWVRFSPLRIAELAPAPLLGAGLALLALALLLASRSSMVGPFRALKGTPGPGRPLSAWAGTGLLASGTLLTTIALARGYARHDGPPPALPPVSPIAATQSSIARGETIYRQSCLACHGVTGRGDGPAAAGSASPVGDLRVHMVAGHTDAELFAWISEGLPQSGMPAFGETLAEEDRWHVANYVRRLGDVSAVTGASRAPP